MGDEPAFASSRNLNCKTTAGLGHHRPSGREERTRLSLRRTGPPFRFPSCSWRLPLRLTRPEESGFRFPNPVGPAVTERTGERPCRGHGGASPLPLWGKWAGHPRARGSDSCLLWPGTGLAQECCVLAFCDHTCDLHDLFIYVCTHVGIISSVFSLKLSGLPQNKVPSKL